MVGRGWSARTTVLESVIYMRVCVCEGTYMGHPDTNKYWKSLPPRFIDTPQVVAKVGIFAIVPTVAPRCLVTE